VGLEGILSPVSLDNFPLYIKGIMLVVRKKIRVGYAAFTSKIVET